VALTLANLFLVLGVVRRLRVHTAKLDRLAKNGPRPEPMIGPGRRPATFSATTLDGRLVTEATVATGGLVGFFSPTCDSCEEWLPRFAEAAASAAFALGPRLAVVVADDDDAASPMVERLRSVAQVVVERKDGPMATAFDVTGYPAICRLDDRGAVVSYQPADVLEAPAAA
jgi:hypothetical protein